jgi:GntR family transcriptional regulator
VVRSQTDRAGVRQVEIAHKSPVKQRIADVLGLDGNLATIVRRTRTVDGALFAFTVNHLPEHYGRMMTVRELRRMGLMTLLESKGVRFASAQQSIRAELADVEVSTRLEMDFGGAVLFAERLLFDDHGGPVEFVQSWYRGDCTSTASRWLWVRKRRTCGLTSPDRGHRRLADRRGVSR